MIWVDIKEERRDGSRAGDVQDLDALGEGEGRERLAWLSQLRHPYRPNPVSGRVAGSPRPDDSYT